MAQREGPRIVRVRRAAGLPGALAGAGLGRPVLVSVGGAGRMDPEYLPALTRFLVGELVPALDRWGVTVLDGGTDIGVMRAMGRARHRLGARFPLVGVAAAGTVTVDGGPGMPVEPHHSHIVLVPGDAWGDESPWLSRAASVLSGPAASATMLVDGGEISYDDADLSLSAGRPLFVVQGTGRAADVIAAAARGVAADARASRIAGSPLTRVVSLARPAAMLDAVAAALGVA
jgi:SLOG in TRPM, prokaryote